MVSHRHSDPVDDNLDDAFNANYRITGSNEPRALDDLAVLLSTSKVLEEKMYDQFCQLILVTNTSDANSGFY